MNLFPVFLVGMLGSLHCIGMCGGIVGALSSAVPPAIGAASASTPLLRYTAAGTASVIAIRPALRSEVSRVLCYNLGRLSSYATAGAIAGGIAAGVLRGADVLGWMLPLQRAAYVTANLLLVLLGLYLTQWWSALAHLEKIGQGLWSLLRPLALRFIPVDTPMRALALGSLWGWLPCGMVYSVLLNAMLSGSAIDGALTMLAFGAGTLPVLLGAGLAGVRMRQLAARPGWRRAAGLAVFGFGVLGLLRAADIGGLGMAHGWLDVLCITPVHGVSP